MNQIREFLKKTQLFAGLQEEEISAVLHCISYTGAQYKAGQTVIHEGDTITSIGLVYKGAVHIVQDDFWGNRSILSRIGPGKLFGEVFALSGSRPANVDVLAVENSEILFFDFKRFLTVCGSACGFHNRLIRNLMNLVLDKNFTITRKLRHISQRTTREKVLAYLSDEYKKNGKEELSIPFDRQQLADYLLVERSALSAELSRMQKDGLVEYHKNHFILKKHNAGPSR